MDGLVRYTQSMNTAILTLIFTTVTNQFHLPPRILSSLCYVESKHNIHAANLADRGEPSLGICQIKLSTARDLGFQGTGKELMEPFTNIYYAGKYLSSHVNKHKSIKKGVVAYNLGHYSPTYRKYYNLFKIAYAQGK